eukprot:GHVP01005808.1.p1 GENE.GHVP01005808.1~~GHVP01005808.1.p1  ORF type:complete len:118 (+),score=14.55 GHVP01005808.1:776-1129(+)
MLKKCDSIEGLYKSVIEDIKNTDFKSYIYINEFTKTTCEKIPSLAPYIFSRCFDFSQVLPVSHLFKNSMEEFVNHPGNGRNKIYQEGNIMHRGKGTRGDDEHSNFFLDWPEYLNECK